MPLDSLTEQQKEFCAKYLVSSKFFGLRGPSQKKIEAVQADFEKYILLRQEVEAEIAMLDDKDTMKAGFSKRVVTNHAKLKDAGKGKDKLDDARQALLVIEIDVRKHQAMEDTLHEQISLRGQKTKHYKNAQITMQEYLAKIRDLGAQIQEKLNEAAKIAPEIAKTFDTPSHLTSAENSYTAAVLKLRDATANDDLDVAGMRTLAEKLIAAFVSEAATFTAALEAILADDDTIKAKIAAQQSCDALKVDLAEARRTIAILETWNVPVAGALASEANLLEKQVHADNPTLESKTRPAINALAARALAARSDRTGDYNTLAAPILERLKALKKRIDDYNNDSASRAAVALPQVREAEFYFNMAHKSLSSGKNPDAIAGIETLVASAELQLQDLNSIIELNTEIKKAIDTMKSDVKKHGGSSAIRKRAWAGHGEAIATFEKDWMTKRPASARSAVTDLAVDIAAEVKRESAQKQWRETQSARVKATREELKTIEAELKAILEANGEKFNGYEGTFKIDLDTAQDWIDTKEALSWQAATEKKIGQTHKAIVTALMNLKGQGTDPANPNKTPAELKLEVRKALIDDHDAMQKATSDAAQKKQALLQIAQGWVVMAEKDAKAHVRAVEYKDETARIIKQVSDMIKNVKKDQQDTESAKQTLTILYKQFEDLLARPPKVDHASLAKLGEHWTASVKAFGDKIKELGDKIKANLPEEAGEEKQKAEDAQKVITARLQDIYSTFETAAFDNAAKVLGASDSALPKRKEAREAALTAVREKRDKLMTDPLIKACVANPYGVSGFASDPHRTLRQIELEVLRGI